MDFFVHYDYTQRNQLAHITQNDYSPLYTYTYDPAGNMTMRRGDIMGDATNVPSNTYDALNRPTYWEQTKGGGAWFGRSHYQYDNVGREVATWREEDGNKGERFWFNTSSHITRALYKADNVSTTSPSNGVLDQQYAYTPDMLNRTSVTENGAVTTYAAPTALNQYTSVGGVEVRYDGNFNLTYYGGATATYDAQNRLTSVSAGGTGGFVYDGLGRCVKRTINGVATQFGYDGWKPVTEYDGAGNLAARNIYGPGPDEILMRGSGFGWFFYHADKQGSVTALVGLDGSVAEKYTYDAFGRPTILSANNTQLSTSAVGNRFMFTGREWIAELNIYDYRNRFYFPAIGRFLQTDPTGFDGGDMNLFRYCGDDPVNATDPTGLRFERPVLSYSGMVDVSFDSGLASMSREQKLDSGNYSMGSGGVLNAGGASGSMAHFSGPAGAMEAARERGNRLPVVITELRTSSTEQFNQGQTSVGSTYGARTPSQATTKASLYRAAGTRLTDGRIQVSQSLKMVTKYPTATPSAALKHAELLRRGAIIGWARDSYPDLAASVTRNRYASPAAAAAAVDKAVRGPFSTYMTRLKIEFDFPIQGQPEL